MNSDVVDAGADRTAFLAWLDHASVAPAPSTREALLAFSDRIRAENPRLGLVSAGDLPRLLTRHVRECLAPPLLDVLRTRSHVLDAGSGGGLPGIVLGIVLPELEIRLIEPKEKRVGFLERSVLSLGLRNVRVIPATLEEAARNPHIRAADALTARALRWTLPMVRALAELLVPEGIVIRFGAQAPLPPDVRAILIEAGGPRAIQVWRAPAWGLLPEAP